MEKTKMATPEKGPDVTIKELLISSLAQTRRARKITQRQGSHHAARVLAEDFKREGNVSKTFESNSTLRHDAFSDEKGTRLAMLRAEQDID